MTQRLAKQELDLGVDAAQLVIRPGAERLKELGIQPEEKGFALCHGSSVKRAGIDNGLGLTLRAKDDQ